MTYTTFRPDQLNGQRVFREIETDGAGINHQNSTILFSPALKVGEPKPVHPEELIEQALTQLITISSNVGDPVIKAQAVKFREQLKRHLAFWLTRAGQNERAIVRAYLMAHGFTQ